MTAESASLEPWSGVAAATTGQTVTVVVRDSGGTRMSDASGPVRITLQDPDTRIVAYWNAATQTWVSTYDGLNYPVVYTVNADRGIARVRVRANTSGMKLYTIQYTHTDNTVRQAQANGMFFPTGADRLTVTASSPSIRRDGSVTLTARVEDQYGQIVSTAAGTVTFVALPGSPITAPMSVTVPIVGGVASATFASNRSVSGQEVVANFYVESTVRRASTDTVLAGNVTVTVDDLAPSLNGVTFRPGPVASGAGTFNTEDEIVLTFSEPINAGDLVTGLTRGSTITPAGATINIIGSEIDFNGLAGLDKVVLNGTTFSALADYTIDAISLNAAGTVLTIRVGTRTAGTDPTLTAPATTADLVTTVPLKDGLGQERLSPFTGAPVSGTP